MSPPTNVSGHRTGQKFCRPLTLGGMSDVTQILQQIQRGDPAAAERLLPLVYDELKRLAATKMIAERPSY